jgi:gp16 family phage-associated protein
METTREQVREEMRKRGLSARRLARELGMKPDTVLDFLKGERPSRYTTQLLICRHLGLEPDSLRRAA